MKIIYKAIGITSLFIGILGAFIPLLPSTCFVLLSAWCFSKSSPRWHQALRKNRFVGNALTQWEENRVIPVNARRIAIVSMLLSGIYSFVVFESFVAKIIILLLLSVSIWAISQIPSSKKL